MQKLLKQKFEKALAREGVFDFARLFHKGFTHSEIYLVGGSVRDIIIGRKIKDIDILIKGSKLQDIKRFLKKHGKVSLVGQRFAVLKFKPKNAEREFDIAIPRVDFPFGSGAYKDVKIKGDPILPIEKDLSRRDFTINALAFDLQKKEIIDPFGGLADIKKKIIKAVGAPEKRFCEDYSRMLRAIRIAIELDFEIEKKTKSAIKKYIKHINDKATPPTPLLQKGGKRDSERKVPYEVIAGEFLRAFDANPKKTIEFYFACGAMYELMPEIYKMKGCSQPKKHHSEGDVLAHTILALEKINSRLFKKYFENEPTLTTKIAILMHDIGKPATKKRIDGEIKFRNHDKKGAQIAQKLISRLKLQAPPAIGIDGEKVVWLIKNHLLFLHSDPNDLKKTTIEKYLFNERFNGEAMLQVFLADASASYPAGKAPNLKRFKDAYAIWKEMKKGRKQTLPAPLLNGNEVMKILNIKPGPEVGKILEELREEQLSGQIKNKTQAKDFVKKYPA